MSEHEPGTSSDDGPTADHPPTRRSRGPSDDGPDQPPTPEPDAAESTPPADDDAAQLSALTLSAPPHAIGAVLRIGPFRRMWISLGLAGLGDWLGLLALTAMARELAPASYSAENFAIAGVLLLRLLPAAFMGPLGGYLADRLNRRWVLVLGCFIRFGLLITIPLVGTLSWLFVAVVLMEMAALVWLPAKDATIPNLVPRERLAVANQLNLMTTYGSALPAAAAFTVLALLNQTLTTTLGWFASSVDLALYFNGLAFLVAGAVIWTVREVGARPGPQDGVRQNAFRVIVDGWRFVVRTRVIRGLIFGIVGAFAASGVVIGLARVYVSDLGAGDAGYGVLFGALFLGLAIGMGVGPRLVAGFSRRRLFGLALIAAGVALVAVALIQNIVIVTFWSATLGLFAGIAWITGYTLLGLEVEDSLRGRTFAFVHSLTRLALSGVLAAAPAIAGAIGRHRVELTDDVVLTFTGAGVTILLGAIGAIVFGVVSYRHMDDRPGVPLLRDLRAAVSGHERGVFSDLGLFIAFEGGEAAGKSTQASALAQALEEAGHEVVLSREPGATRIGKRLRTMLLDVETGRLSPRTEALLYAADRAEHVDTVIRPALSRGAIVITDRYVDSSLAYQGAGRDLGREDVLRLSSWATRRLRPHLVILLDLPPESAAARTNGAVPDRLEVEPLEFHTRVREQFLNLAALNPDRYLVVDATKSVPEIVKEIRERVDALLAYAHVTRRPTARNAEGQP